MRNIEICSACGSDEAMGNGMVPVADWPIVTSTSPAKLRADKAIWDGEHRVIKP